MAHIILNEEQARVVSMAAQGVEVRDSLGRPLAFFKPLSPDEVAHVVEARRRLQAGGPRVPSARVLNMLAEFQLLDEKGEATPDKINAIVERVTTRDSR
jgi:hypothetical protein